MNRRSMLKILEISLVSVLLVTAACAPLNQSATKKYDGVKSEGVPRLGQPEAKIELPAPPAPEKPEEEPARAPRPELITLMAIDEQGRKVEEMMFEEGVQRQQRILAKIANTSVQYDLVASNLPEGATLSPVDRDTYMLTWNPKVGQVIVPPNADQKLKLSVQLVVKNLTSLNNTDKALADELESLNKSKHLSAELKLRVAKSGAVPAVLSASPDPAKGFKPVMVSGRTEWQITEGDTAEGVIRFVVRDTTTVGLTGSEHAPLIRVGPEGKASSYGDGSVLVKGTEKGKGPLARGDYTVVSSGNGQWTYMIYLDVVNRKLPAAVNPANLSKAKEAPSTLLRISVIFKSQKNQVESAEQLVDFRVNYKRNGSKPEISQNEVSFVRGQSGSQTFSVSTKDANGKVEVINPHLSLNNLKLAGNPQVNCTPSNPQLSLCTISWNVPCEGVPTAIKPFKIKAKNTLNEREYPEEFNMTLKVSSPAAGTCSKGGQAS